MPNFALPPGRAPHAPVPLAARAAIRYCVAHGALMGRIAAVLKLPVQTVRSIGDAWAVLPGEPLNGVLRRLELKALAEYGLDPDDEDAEAVLEILHRICRQVLEEVVTTSAQGGEREVVNAAYARERQKALLDQAKGVVS
jgi:hypothetical protein